MNGLMTICHDARKGGYIGSHWPNQGAPLLYSTNPLSDRPGPESRPGVPSAPNLLVSAGLNA